MRIVHALRSVRLSEGGVARAVIDLCGALAKLGEEVTLLARETEDVPGSWRSGVEGLPRLLAYRSAGERTARRAVASADAVHLHVPWDPDMLAFAKAAREESVPYAVSIHGMLDDWSMAQSRLKKRFFLALAGRRMLERASLVHCTAEAELDQSRKWYARGRGRVVPLIMDLGPYVDLPGEGAARTAFERAYAGGGRRVLFLSRLHPKKGLGFLIPAMARVAERAGDVRLLIAGSGDPEHERAMRGLAARCGIAERTHFLGLVGGEVKVSLYQSADVFVVPTAQENFGFVFPEALACGTPVVTTKGVDIWAELEASGGTEIVDREPAAIAEAVIGLLGDPDRLGRMGSAGRSWVLGRFGGDTVPRMYRAMYEDMAAERERHG